jgi:hypothetical protein
MKSTAFICGLAACAVAGELWAKEYPLTLTPLTVEEAAALPAGAGVYAQLQLTKPAELKREPPGAAGQSIYGVIGRAQGNSGMIFRLDGTTGEKGGHDRLLLDLNQNGDLTDEAPIKVTGTPKIARSGSYTTETAWFGPIQAPAARRIAPGTPTYFAQL